VIALLLIGAAAFIAWLAHAIVHSVLQLGDLP
jgi:hypothetical protein